MWKEGSIKVNGEIFHYWMKQYEGGSERGCCSLYRKSHRIRWRLFFMPFVKKRKAPTISGRCISGSKA